MIFKKRKKNKYGKIDFDANASFIDSKNLADFDTDKFDGVIENPISQKNFMSIFVIFFIIVIVFLFKTFYYQILNGQEYALRAMSNFTREAVIFYERGVIFDRNGIELAWNEKSEEEEFPKRAFIDKTGFAHILGFISYPQKDRRGNFFEKEYIGRAGVERYFNDHLNGVLGAEIIEVNARGKIVSNNVIKKPESGENLHLSIDAFLQNKMAIAIQNYIDQEDFIGGAGLMMNIKTGEILAMVSLPEYSSSIMTEGKDREKISEFILDKGNPFLNKTTYGLYTPGSIVKPFVALAALDQNIVDENYEIHTRGQLIIPNRFHPDKPSIFRDWKDHGVVDIKESIAVSSNIFFYIIGGGFQDKVGLGIKRMKENYRQFGFGEKTNIQAFVEKRGLVPTPEWKEKTFENASPWNVGNTYHVSIGQFGFLITPMQALVAVSAIANNGKIIEPNVIKGAEKRIRREVVFEQKDFNTVIEGMRQTSLIGTSRTLDFNFVEIAAKTGSAQIKGNTRENSWIIGFFPYDDPKYSFVFLAEDGPNTSERGVSNAAREFFLEIKKEPRAAEEYFGIESVIN